MSHTWQDFISEVLSMLIYGWSWHEIVFKRRIGPWETDPKRRSKFTDGQIGWRKLPIRSQETMLRWIFDDSGDTTGMVQIAPPMYRTVPIPMDRSLLFRYRQYKGSPEGISMLRGAYRPWFFKKRIEEFEAIGVERDLAGLPIAKIPAEMLRASPGTEQAKNVEVFKKIVRSVRRNDQEGMVWPMAYDQETKQPLYSFELLGGGGSRQFNTSEIIQRHEQRILMTVLADFILVGHEGSGSYSMHLDKTGIFRTSLNIFNTLWKIIRTMFNSNTFVIECIVVIYQDVNFIKIYLYVTFTNTCLEREKKKWHLLFIEELNSSSPKNKSGNDRNPFIKKSSTY
jgi:hypothetical protein